MDPPPLTVEDDNLNFKFSGSFALLRMTVKKRPVLTGRGPAYILPSTFY